MEPSSEVQDQSRSAEYLDTDDSFCLEGVQHAGFGFLAKETLWGLFMEKTKGVQKGVQPTRITSICATDDAPRTRFRKGRLPYKHGLLLPKRRMRSMGDDGSYSILYRGNGLHSPSHFS